MNVDSGTFAKATGFTGSTTYLMNDAFTPHLLTFYISGKPSDTETHIAIGYWHTDGLDGTVQASAGKSSETRTKTLSHYAGTTEKISFTCTGVASGEFTLNWAVADVNYLIHWIAQA